MMKAILEFTDLESGEINISLTFDPPVKGDDAVTPAVQAAIDAIRYLKGDAE